MGAAVTQLPYSPFNAGECEGELPRWLDATDNIMGIAPYRGYGDNTQLPGELTGKGMQAVEFIDTD